MGLHHAVSISVMTGEAIQTEEDEDLVLPDSLVELQGRVTAAGLSSEAVSGWNDDEVQLLVNFPQGRESRGVEYGVEDVEALQSIDLAAIRFLPDLLGYVDTNTGAIEVQLRLRSTFQMRRVPGFKVIPSDEPDAEEPDEEFTMRMPRLWRIVVDRNGVELELSPRSEEFRAVRGLSQRSGITTLKIRGLAHASTEETLRSLESLSDAFFFDLDVRYGVVLELMQTPGRLRPPVRARHARPATFPTNKYLSQPAALYRYGRSASGLPLLSFLAFYQVLEFFFPIFTQNEVTQRVQQTLRNPRFDPSDDVSVLRLVEAIRPSMRLGVSEKEQLRASIRRCLTNETIKDFINSSTNTSNHFCQKVQSVPGLVALKPDSGTPDLRDQVADRIYDIRCRIVHTKSDGGESGVELLLPSGPEARSLGPDIELVRLAAQEAIIAGASPLDLN